MSIIEIEGGHELYGKVRIQGSKNATLPVMAATLLNGGISIIKNYPDIEDVWQMKNILETLGCEITLVEDEMIVDSQPAKDEKLGIELTGKIRASSVLLGPMLARFHHVKIARPGGCKIGSRPLDIHMNVFKAFGASWTMTEDDIEVECVRLHPAQIRMAKKSVGATENAIMVASMIRGESRIVNAAIEPEIMTLCEFLRNIGARIQVCDHETIIVEGGECNHASIVIPGDRIVAGTYMGAVAMCRGKIELSGMQLEDCRGFLNVLTGMGMNLVKCDVDTCIVSMSHRPDAINLIQTAPYPGFPTDMQPIVMACMSIAKGQTRIVEHIFEHRFGAAKQLQLMGADMRFLDNQVYVNGVEKISGAQVLAQDLRGAAALVIAGMAAEGITRISQVEYLNRGYYQLIETMNKLGAKIYAEESID